MSIADFSFQEHAPNFDEHIGASIPGYDELNGMVVKLSRTFVQPCTRVIDIGCSTGRLIAAIRAHNQSARSDVAYHGLDWEDAFNLHWKTLPGIKFDVCDAYSYAGLENMSFVTSLFTLQFVRPADRIGLLRRIYNGLVDGGAFIVAERTLASCARMQDALTFPYYDFKIGRGFSEKEILDKERALRGLMRSWRRSEMIRALRTAGFQEIDYFWANYSFAGLLAIK